uniref:Uncharacterized protein n=1 Tax=Anguilla anguilla TaxID=7936 RepID=A0A0E9Q5E5_ANGAN
MEHFLFLRMELNPYYNLNII